VLAVGAFLARVLQVLVLYLEAAIEWLGHEPERRWENLLFLRGMEVSAPNVPTLVRRATRLQERGDGEGALRLFVKILELEPDNTQVLDAAAEVLSELGCVTFLHTHTHTHKHRQVGACCGSGDIHLARRRRSWVLSSAW
jgi:hypothetical protein